MRLFLILSLLVVSGLAYASEAVTAPVAPAWVAMAASALALLMQVLKSPALGGLLSGVTGLWLPVVTALVGQLIAVVEMLATGKPWKVVAVEYLFVSGGAMAIYDTVIKPALSIGKK